MRLGILAFLVLLPWSAVDGDEDGRRGNEFYAQQQYALAVESYDRGLAALSDEAPRLLRYGLLNNLGAALLKSGDGEAAAEAFARALATAPEPADVARTSYNSGNASFAAQDLETALEHYRESLLADPASEDAKFNYEFVKRRLQQQQQEQQQQGEQENEDQQDQQQGDQEQEGGDQEQEQQQDDQEDGASQQDQQESPLDQDEEREQQAQQQPSPSDLSEEQAQQILQALQNEEEQLLRQVQRPTSRPRKVEKDW